MREIEAAGGRVIALDVTDDASIVACVDRIIDEQGRIDVLINNAGYCQVGALEKVQIDEDRGQMENTLDSTGHGLSRRHGSGSTAEGW